MDIDSNVIGGSSIEGPVGVGLGCGTVCDCPLIFLLVPSLPHPFLGKTEEAVGRGLGTGLGTLLIGLGIPFLLA